MKANIAVAISPLLPYCIWQNSGSQFMSQNADNQSLEKHGG